MLINGAALNAAPVNRAEAATVYSVSLPLRQQVSAAVHGQSCASCGDPIDPRRIVIMPDAVRCVTCEDASRP